MNWSRALLLDTHAAIWLAAGKLTDEVVESIVFAGLADGVFVSPVSAWEIGLLARPSRRTNPVEFRPDARTWYASLLSKPIIKEAPLTWRAAIDSADLPEPFHSDPADRLLVATARELDIPLLTRDRNILAYAKAGHVRAQPC